MNGTEICGKANCSTGHWLTLLPNFTFHSVFNILTSQTELVI